MIDRSSLSMPKTRRDWAIGLAIVAVIGGLCLYVFQSRIEQGEDACRAKCAGAEGYRYTAPRKTIAESCTCVGRR
jgi:hypothetical protein